MGPDWMLDELAHAGAEHLDAEFVAAFDRKQGDIARAEAAADVEVLASHGVDRHSTVVDLGAGTGRFTTAIAPHVKGVIAVDISPVMLRRLAEQIADAGVTGPDGGRNVTVVQGGLLSYEHRGASVDAVHTRHALHQLPDVFKAVALHRIAQLLRPGGVLRLRDLVYDTTPDRLAGHLDAWFAGASADPSIGYTRAELVQHVREEHSTFTWLLEAMIDRAGFVVEQRDVRRGVHAAYTCVRR